MKRALLLLSVFLAAGCASVDPYARAPIAAHLRRADPVGDCARLFQRVDQAIDAAGVRDVQARQMQGFPYLRVDRLSARLAPEPADADAQRAWRERLAALDRDARVVEIANAGTAASARDIADLDACRARLADADRAADALRSVARVDDDYSLLMRTLGVYPLTKFAFAAGINKWHAETLDLHALPLAQLPRLGEAVRYAPRPPLLLASTDTFTPPAVDALGVPRLTPALVEALLARHAPTIEVDTVDSDDRLGQLVWGEGGRRVVADTTRPVAYGRVAYTQVAGRIVPQLVYTFWFPARPAQGTFDALAGNLDGIVWRVTLGADLQPLVYDTIHPCGCYHLFYPTGRVRDRSGPIAGVGPHDESLFVPQRVDAPRDGERQVLHIAARSHYLRRVENGADGAPAEVQYALRDDNDLRAMPWPNESAPRGTRSAYGPDGLMSGSERLERFFFWPMGIDSAGQMRQWGHHATAFVGRRHFDDPDLFDRYFELAGPAGADPLGAALGGAD
jgi:hypothetical protein